MKKSRDESRFSMPNLPNNLALHERFDHRQNHVKKGNAIHDMHRFQFGRQRFLEIAKKRLQRLDARPQQMTHPHVSHIEDDDQTI
jgi:hypothetical protein